MEMGEVLNQNSVESGSMHSGAIFGRWANNAGGGCVFERLKCHLAASYLH